MKTPPSERETFAMACAIFAAMSSQTLPHIVEANAIDASATIARLMEKPSPNAWIPLAFGVLCLLAGTIVVTNTGEQFTLDD